MTTQVRREILHVLGELSQCCPDVRFGQLIANLSYLAKSPTHEAIWDVEDAALRSVHTSNLTHILSQLNLSLAVSTYHAKRLTAQ